MRRQTSKTEETLEIFFYFTAPHPTLQKLAWDKQHDLNIKWLWPNSLLAFKDTYTNTNIMPFSHFTCKAIKSIYHDFLWKAVMLFHYIYMYLQQLLCNLIRDRPIIRTDLQIRTTFGFVLTHPSIPKSEHSCPQKYVRPCTITEPYQ